MTELLPTVIGRAPNSLKSTPPPPFGLAAVVSVQGYAAPDDGRGGQFYWDKASTEEDDGATIVTPDAGGTGRWKRLCFCTTGVRASCFGARIDTDKDGHGYRLFHIACPTCELDDTVFVGMRGGKYQRYGLGIATRIVQCRSCSLMYPNPFPFPVDPQKLYGDPEKYFAHQDSQEKVEKFRLILRHARSAFGRAPNSALDVGSGRGEFLYAAKLDGWPDVVGLELSHAAIDYARKKYEVTVVPQTVETFAGSARRTFDLVILNAVLEHVHDPDATLAAIAELTHPGSLLYVDIPNEPHLLTEAVRLANKLRRRPGVINLAPTFPPYHVFGFNPKSLTRLLGKHGFDVKELAIRALPSIANDGSLMDRARCAAASVVMHAANMTGTASNMFVWSLRRG